ncbi:thioesterase domain-containing protein [Luteolibacter yonseiensis]|uniref:Thioesterase domain-containing protein n=1 Tax=Luteolibacter yonseiensis TaxID=1144680 RepID=A0A934VDA2_9BACT|nr:YiiD C-terminal domain-containing protein [Luteolibacter yonseiensis]MBK1817806.1 thioesterase domain-containing protein [Luteolibacter yonseiensis]
MSNETLRRETEAFFHAQIPITRAMGVAVERFDAEALILTAPLAVNHNHLGTAFGGSLSSIATLAGYGVLWMLLDDRNCHIVVKSSSVEYLCPVHGDIRAIARCPDETTFAAFKNRFGKKGKARIRLHVTIEEGGETCVGFEGIFVALKE